MYNLPTSSNSGKSPTFKKKTPKYSYFWFCLKNNKCDVNLHHLHLTAQKNTFWITKGYCWNYL